MCRRIQALLIDLARLESSKSSKKKNKATVPPPFDVHEDEIKTVCRKAALAFHPWPDERWFKSKHKPRDVDWKDCNTRYRTKKSKDDGFKAELWDYLKGEDCPVDLRKFLGRQTWFGALVSLMCIVYVVLTHIFFLF